MKQNQSLSELKTGIIAIMRGKGYSEETLKDYSRIWSHLEKYMLHFNLISLNNDVVDGFMEAKFGSQSYSSLTESQKKKAYCIKVLVHFQENGSLLRRTYNKEIIFSGPNKVFFNDFMDEVATMTRSEQTIKAYKYRINPLYQDLLVSDHLATDITIPYLMQFLSRLDRAKKPIQRNHVIGVVRRFIKYLCSRKLLWTNREEYWMPVLRPRQISQPKLPSVFSADEVENLIKSVDRANPRGKRDYAMILLAARYGLRASDIIGLRYCNIDWANNQIILVQQKNGKRIELPLSEEIGNAIIDYLKFGRPAVEEPYIFITAQAPYGKITNVTTLTEAVSKNMKRADIPLGGRKHGGHCLRHSLASNLLALKQPMPVISEVLGHTRTASTMAYLRVDFHQLKQCALDVPCVPSSFYENLYV